LESRRFNKSKKIFSKKINFVVFLGRSLRHISCKNLKNWVVFYPSSLRELGDELINALYQVCLPFGMEVEYPNV
jgi:hypothetical protein